MSKSRRPPIPDKVKAIVYARDPNCQVCRQEVAREEAEFNHEPPLKLRQRDPAFPKESDPRHYIPNANDTDFIFTIHGKKAEITCHKHLTFKPGWVRQGDKWIPSGHVQQIARVKRLDKKRAAGGSTKPKKKWGSRKVRSNPIVPGSKNHHMRMKYNKVTKRFEPQLRDNRGT